MGRTLIGGDENREMGLQRSWWVFDLWCVFLTVVENGADLWVEKVYFLQRWSDVTDLMGEKGEVEIRKNRFQGEESKGKEKTGLALIYIVYHKWETCRSCVIKQIQWNKRYSGLQCGLNKKILGSSVLSSLSFQCCNLNRFRSFHFCFSKLRSCWQINYLNERKWESWKRVMFDGTILWRLQLGDYKATDMLLFLSPWGGGGTEQRKYILLFSCECIEMDFQSLSKKKKRG